MFKETWSGSPTWMRPRRSNEIERALAGSGDSCDVDPPPMAPIGSMSGQVAML